LTGGLLCDNFTTMKKTPQSKTKQDEHPFFCEKRKCRKTAWQTPEYLTEQDWLTVQKVINIITSGDTMAFYRFVTNDENSKMFFYRVIGWPEGFVYCCNLNYCVNTGFKALTLNLDLMREALERQSRSLFRK
jgi:hypothetical protein